MGVRRLPVRPDLEQLHRQAKELLRAIHAGEADAVAELREHHSESIDASSAKLADAQLVLARSYRFRLDELVQQCSSPTRSGVMTSRRFASCLGNSALIHGMF
jgi:hypothetical protein